MLLTSVLGLVLAMLVLSLTTWIAAQALEGYLGVPVFTEDEGLSPRIFGDLGAMVLMVLPPQVALALLAVALAILSRRPASQALGLRRPRASGSELMLLVLGLPAAMVAGALLVRLLVGDAESPTMDHIRRLIAAPEDVPEMLAMGAMLSLAPAVAEELFFRGWLQRRLVEGVGPVLGVSLASLAFAAVHMDPVQSTGVLPISFLLGYVTWRTGSLWPAVLGHAAFNGFQVSMTLLVPEPELLGPDDPLARGVGTLMLLSPVALMALVYLLERRARVLGPRAET